MIDLLWFNQCVAAQANAAYVNYLVAMQNQAAFDNNQLWEQMAQYHPPVPPPKPFEGGWREPQSEWAKIP